MQEVTDNQKKYFTVKKKLKVLVGQHSSNEREMLLQLKKIKALLKIDNSLDRKIDLLTIQKETTTMEKQRLIVENLKRKSIREENTIYINTLKNLKNNTEKERNLLNAIKQDIMKVSVPRHIYYIIILDPEQSEKCIGFTICVTRDLFWYVLNRYNL